MFGCCCKGPSTPPGNRKGNNSSSKENLVESPKSAQSKSNQKRNKSPSKGYTNKAESNNNIKQHSKQTGKSSSSKNNNNIVKPESVILTEVSSQQAGRRNRLHSTMAANLESLVVRLEAAVAKLETKTTGGGGGSSEEATVTAPYVVAYDEIVSGPFQQYITISNKLGGDIKAHSDIVQRALIAQRQFLDRASKVKTPPQDVLMKLLQPTSEEISAVQAYRENNRRSEYFNHLSAISESVPSLGWVAVSPTPGPFVKEMSDAGQFYSNRVLKDFKEKDKTHVDWVKSWGEFLSQLMAYIKQHHTTGVSWNAQGIDAATVLTTKSAGGAPPPPPPAGGPPPPPPPPPADLVAAPSGGANDGAKAALFADLNKGADVTKGLKKVSDDMKTHKNPTLRQGPAPFKPNISPKPFRAVQAAPAKKQEIQKPSKCALEGKKWIVEYYNGNKSIVIEDPSIKHVVYIYKCVDSVIQVKGKVNSIVMDNCKKSAVVFESLVSAMEFVNCQSVKGQANGNVATVSIDKTDGCMMYLSKDSASAEIVTAKSSEMNILIPDAGGEYKEYALPEQYKTTFDGKKMITTATDSI